MLRFLARGFFLALPLLAWVATACAAPTAPSGLTASNFKATSFTLTWAAATGGTGGIAGYSIYQDGISIGSTTAARTFAVSSLAPNSVYNITVTARDGAGVVSVQSAPLVVTTPPDTTVPTKPADLVAVNVTTSSCTLTWTGSTDNVGVIGYNIYRSGVLLGSSPTTAFDVGGLAPDTTNNLTVRATDAAGNLSAASIALAVRTFALPPSAPTGLAVTALKATSFTLTWTASSGGTGGIAGYEVYQNGMLIGFTTTARTFAVSGLTPTTAYSMTVSSRDTAGNLSPTSGTLEVTTSPDTTVPTRPANLVAANITTTSFTLTWSGSTDNVGVAGYNIYRGGVLLGSSAVTTYGITGLIPDSTNNITVRAVDAAGNLSAASIALSVRMIALPTSIPAGLAVTALRPSSFTLQWSASTGGTGGIKGYEVYLNEALIGSPTTRSLAVSGLVPQTTYSMTVASYDSVGNVSTTSEPLVVSTPADTTKPTVPKGLSADNVTPTSFSLTWTASTDNVGVAGYDVYRNNLLIGSTPAPVFAVMGLTPATLSSMRVKAKDAASNISGFSVILPVTTSAQPNVPPTIILNSPSDGSSFTLPFTLAVSASAADSDGTVTKVEFFDNGIYLGETTDAVSGQSGIWLLTLSSELAAGSHALSARATDNENATADSIPVAITINNPNLSPTITITAPATGTSLVAPGFITVTVDATDSDGTITKVEFYEGGNFLGAIVTPTTPPSTYTFPLTLYSTGTYTITAVATDNSTDQTISNKVAINVNSGAVALPFAANFEPAEGYRAGALNGQLSWVATGGVVVVPSITTGGLQELSIPAAQPSEIYSHDFSATGVSPVFVDFQAQPVAGSDPATAVMFSTPAAQVALVGTSSPAQLWIFGGGVGWYATSNTVALDASGRSVGWLRLTTREDYLTKKWDLYLNGRMIAADVGFADPMATALTDFSVNGHATATSAFDSFYAGPEDPLFADVNHNGLDDAWETAHGLPLSADNRQLSPTNNGVTVLQAYLGGTDPNDFYNGAVPILSVLSGDNQSAALGQFNAHPLVISVKNASGTALANAPVTFTVTTGGGLLSIAATGPTPAAALSLLTAADGTAQAFYQQPATPGTSNQITAAAGTSQVTFQSSSVSASDAPLFNIDFETEEGFVGGPIDGQNGWQTRYGTGGILADATAPSGAQVASVDAFSGIAYTFPTPLSGLCNVDFYARPVAGPNGYHATQYVVGDVGLSFALNPSGDAAQVYTLNYNDYQGPNSFVPTGIMVPVGPDGSTGWLHVRLKLNFAHPHWDLYIDSALIASNCYMENRQAGAIMVINGASDSAYFDHLKAFEVVISSDNPDSDGNGLLDAWEIQYFDYVGVDADADPDGDGFTNLQEFQDGTDPNDYFDGTPPNISIVSGDNQSAPLGQFNTQPLVIVVTNAAGAPLSNAPVSFSVTSGSGFISISRVTPELASTISFRTSADGTAQIYYQQPTAFNNVGVIESFAGSAQVSVSFAGVTDSDHNNLSDAWELQFFGHLGVDPEGDPDEDGFVNLEEAGNRTSPLDFFNGEKPQIASGVGPDGHLPLSGFFTVKVLHQDGQSWPYAPVIFHVNNGTTRFKLAPEDPDFLDTIEVRAGADGVAAVYAQGVAQ